QGRHAEAIEHLSAALKTKANYTDARLRLANSLRHVSRAADAVLHYDQVLVEAPDNTEARFNRAIAFVQLHRYRDARNSLADAMQRDLLRGAEQSALKAVVPRLAHNLAKYEHREPCRTPWTTDELP